MAVAGHGGAPAVPVAVVNTAHRHPLERLVFTVPVAFMAVAVVPVAVVAKSAMTVPPVGGAQRVVSAPRITGHDPADRTLDRVGAPALQPEADPVGHQASHYRAR